jgi:hypothetical protein
MLHTSLNLRLTVSFQHPRRLFQNDGIVQHKQEAKTGNYVMIAPNAAITSSNNG